MGLVAERFVEEWLHRNTFFTVRGLTVGRREIDLLALRAQGAEIEKVHYEVSVSVNPLGYMTPLTSEAMKELGARSLGSAVKRTSDIARQCTEAWVHKKFLHPEVVALREHFSSGPAWKMAFVHGAMNYPEELEHIRNCGVETIHINTIIDDLRNPRHGRTTSGEVKDMMRMMELLAQ